jgi:putative spermidine/putrescine transport system substrate-binding protein
MRTALSLALLVLTLALACSEPEKKPEASLLDQDFAAVTAKAKGQAVRWYMYGGFAHVNAWVDGYVAPELKARHGITLERVPMDAAVFVNKMLAEKAAGKAEGAIDLLWINGENFRNSMEAGLLFGPFADKLPNFKAYVDPAGAAYDFGYPVKGYESPWGRAQFVFEHDAARTPTPPDNVAALKAWILAHPGRFTYPMPPDFTGSAFVRQLFYALTGGHEQYMQGFDKALFERNAPALWAWLNEIKPALWQAGRSYPRDAAALDTLFARGEVDFSMSYHPSHAASKILEGTYPDTARTFVPADGSLYNTHFLAIPANSPHKAAAMVAADFLLSPEAQLAKFDPRNWGDFPAIDVNRLPEDWRKKFADQDLGPATLTPAALAKVAVPEIPARYLELLEAGWEANVLHR